MKRTKNRIFIFAFVLIGIIIFGGIVLFNNIPSQTGQVIRANEDSIWITPGFSKINFENKTDEELAELFKFKGTIFQLPWYIPNGYVEELTPGQRVKIYYDGSVRLSAPSQSGAFWLTIINE